MLIPLVLAWSLVAHVAVSSSTNGTVTSAAVNTTGADLLVIVTADYGANPSVLTDSKGNVWTARNIQNNSSFCRGVIYDAVQPVIVGAGHTFTLTGAGTYPAGILQAWSGSTAPAFDQQNGSNSADVSLTSEQPGSVTPGLAGELLITGLANGSIVTAIGVNASFVLGDSLTYGAGASFGISIASLVQGAATAVNPTWSWTGADVYSSALIATYKVGAGGGATCPPTLRLLGVGC